MKINYSNIYKYNEFLNLQESFLPGWQGPPLQTPSLKAQPINFDDASQTGGCGDGKGSGSITFSGLLILQASVPGSVWTDVKI